MSYIHYILWPDFNLHRVLNDLPVRPTHWAVQAFHSVDATNVNFHRLEFHHLECRLSANRAVCVVRNSYVGNKETFCDKMCILAGTGRSGIFLFGLFVYVEGFCVVWTDC